MLPSTPSPPYFASTERRAPRPLPMLIFSSRGLQLPIYLGLIVAQCVHVFPFLRELWHLVTHAVSLASNRSCLSSSA